ncbi:DUF2202 domain-containing protein [bacterium]|nr:DUF2202 domain-containing protein [bacterium]
MKSKWITAIVALTLTMGTLFVATPGYAQTCRNLIVVGEISELEASSLVYMREEEKMARDVYIAMFELWQLPVFSNIAHSEQNHMDAVARLLDAYEIEDPAQDFGLFTNPDLQGLYNELIQRGSTSELDALKVGALIEEVDIKDLQDILAESTSVTVQQVYSRLLAGSGNHLRAYAGYVELIEGSYVAQYLTQEEVDAILAAENTNRQGNGRGGRGMSMNGQRGNCQNMDQSCLESGLFIDEDGDGVCDLCGASYQANQKSNRGRGNRAANTSSRRGGRRGN